MSFSEKISTCAAHWVLLLLENYELSERKDTKTKFLKENRSGVGWLVD